MYKQKKTKLKKELTHTTWNRIFCEQLGKEKNRERTAKQRRQTIDYLGEEKEKSY